MSKSRLFHSVGAADINERPKNELEQMVVLLSLTLIKSHKF